MQNPGNRLGTVAIALVGVALATLSAWRNHDMALVGLGLAVIAAVGAGAVYVGTRRR